MSQREVHLVLGCQAKMNIKTKYFTELQHLIWYVQVNEFVFFQKKIKTRKPVFVGGNKRTDEVSAVKASSLIILYVKCAL